MFIINQYGHYFEVDSNLDVDTNAFTDCLFFDNEQSMLEVVCQQQSLEMEEVEGSTFYVTEQEGSVFVINDRCDKEELEGAVETFLSEYQL